MKPSSPPQGEEADDAWVELLLTDSLDRPLGSAPFLLEAGETTRRGRVGPDGWLGFAWPREPHGAPAGSRGFVARCRLLVCHRTLVLGRSATEGPAWDRNRLTNVGFDAGTPDTDIDPERLASARAAFDRAARTAGVAGDPDALLDAWYEGSIGVAAVLQGAANRAVSGGFVRRWRARRAARRAESARSGSHLGEHEDGGVGVVAIALRVGPRGDARCKNRLVVYDWFSGYGSPPREGNAIALLIDGEDGWSAVARDIERSRSELCISSWFADPDIELRRPEELALANPERRAVHRLATLVEGLARRGGLTSILIWNWAGTPILQRTLRRWAVTAGDGIEVLQHAHPHMLGSFHEKTIVIDRHVAYCGGFNLRQNDWDTQAHRVDDPRRNPHAMAGWDRRAPEPQYPPRHDLGLRVEGPLVADIHQNFTQHWNGTLRRERRALRRLLGPFVGALLGSGPARAIRTMAVLPEARSGGVLAQFVRTDPRLAKRQQAIVDVTLRAILNARQVIYIENQFFRSPRVTEALVAALRRKPRLQLIIVTNEVGPPLRALNPAAYWTHLAQEALRKERADFTLHHLLACGEIEGAVTYRPVFNHAKVMVVDDEWATVGSANLNDRSIYSEYEANIAIEDAPFASRLRIRLMAEHLGLPEDDPRLEDGPSAAALWRVMAQQNADDRAARRLARGLAHPFFQRGALRLLRGRPGWF